MVIEVHLNWEQLHLLENIKPFSTAAVCNSVCRSRKGTGVTNNTNEGSVLFKFPSKPVLDRYSWCLTAIQHQLYQNTETDWLNGIQPSWISSPVLFLFLCQNTFLTSTADELSLSSKMHKLMTSNLLSLFVPLQSSSISVTFWASLTMETPRLEGPQLSSVEPSYRQHSPKHVTTYTPGWPVCRVQQVGARLLVSVLTCRKLW